MCLLHDWSCGNRRPRPVQHTHSDGSALVTQLGCHSQKSIRQTPDCLIRETFRASRRQGRLHAARLPGSFA
jgi:hypothetical protein